MFFTLAKLKGGKWQHSSIIFIKFVDLWVSWKHKGLKRAFCSLFPNFPFLWGNSYSNTAGEFILVTQTDVSNHNLPTKVFILKKEDVALSNFIAVRSSLLGFLYFFSKKIKVFKLDKNNNCSQKSFLVDSIKLLCRLDKFFSFCFFFRRTEEWERVLIPFKIHFSTLQFLLKLSCSPI